MSDNEKLLQKIRALFRLADTTRGATPDEAELAMQKAQALMVKHGIKKIQVDVGDEQGQFAGVNRVDFQTGRKKSYSDDYVALILNTCFNVRILWRKTHEIVNGRPQERLTYVIIGEPTAIEFAKGIITELNPMMDKLCKAFCKARGHEWNTSACHSFYKGLTKGIIAACEKAKAETLRQENVAESQYQLMVVDVQQSIERYVKDNLNVKPSRQTARRSNFDAEAYAHGVAVGSKLKLGLQKLEAA